MVRGSGHTVGALLLGLGCWAACGGNYESSEEPRGGNNQACFENETCYGDLVCLVGRCLSKENVEGGASTSSSSSSTSSGGGSSSSGSSSSGSPVAAACDDRKKCFPNSYPAEFVDDNACVKAYGALTGTTLEGTDPKCGPGAVCGELTAECSKGTLANSKKCIYGGQCTTGNCKGFTGTVCGTCEAAKQESDLCGVMDFFCGGDLRCDFAVSKCVKAVGVDGDCSGAAAGNCKSGLVCHSTSKKCAKPGQIGDACAFIPSTTISTDCRGGLSCKDNKCADVAPKFIDADAACDPARYQTERCRSGFACDATSKKCQKPAASSGLDCKN